MICNNMELCNLCTYTILEHHITAFSFFFSLLSFGNNAWGNGEEKKRKRRSVNNVLSYTLKSVYIHRTIPYIRFSSSLIPHPSSLSFCLSFHLLFSFLLSFPFIFSTSFSRRIHTLRPILRTKRHLNRFRPNSSRNQSLSHFRQTGRSGDL